MGWQWWAAAYRPVLYVKITHPEWSKNAAIYQVNTRQFTQEGTFKAAEKELPRLKVNSAPNQVLSFVRQNDKDKVFVAIQLLRAGADGDVQGCACMRGTIRSTSVVGRRIWRQGRRWI